MAEETIEGSNSISLQYIGIHYAPKQKSYIALETGSIVSIFLTPYYATDAEVSRAILDHPALRNKLISPRIPYLLEHAQFWCVDFFSRSNEFDFALFHMPGTSISTCGVHAMHPAINYFQADLKILWQRVDL